jgi:hypothetical protein
MQLIKKLFGRPPDATAGAESAQFQDSEDAVEGGSRNAPRRELVQVVLRDSMRRHGIPTAWIECRIVSVLSRNARTGMHVQLIVRDGVDRLLTYVPAFQTSFMQEIARFDPRAGDWLLSLSWQFQNLTPLMATKMPDPAAWSAPPSTVPIASDVTPAMGAAAPMEEVAMRPTPAPSVPAATLAPTASRPVVVHPPVDVVGDAEVLEDLQALYAIRDAALRQQRGAARSPGAEPDFESTRPGADQDAPNPSLSAPPAPRRW